MPRLERERLGFIVSSPDWRVANDFADVTGVLITRLAPAEYALFKDGIWKRYKLVEWQVMFETIIPAGLSTGAWAVLPNLVYRLGSYKQTFDKVSMQAALDKASLHLLAIKKVEPRRIRGLNKGDRQTVML